MSKDKPVLSIVIAAYNTEKYIEKCLASIITNTSNIDEKVEIIIVNDGSTDNTREVSNKYLANHTRLNYSIIDVNNGGPSRARNIGVKESSGKYFMFLDSDDFLESGVLTDIINELKTTKPDCCYWGYQNYDEVQKKYFGRYEEKFSYTENAISGEQAFINNVSRKMWICTGNACYKKSIYEKMNFLDYSDLMYGEDFLFTMSFLLMAEKVTSINKIGLNVTIRQGSLMHSKYQDYHLSTFKALDILNARIDLLDRDIDKNELKKWVDAEYEIQRMSIAKLIISSNKGLSMSIIDDKCKVIPDKKKIDYRKLNSYKIIESFIFNHMFGLYVVLAKYTMSKRYE